MPPGNSGFSISPGGVYPYSYNGSEFISGGVVSCWVPWTAVGVFEVDGKEFGQIKKANPGKPGPLSIEAKIIDIYSSVTPTTYCCNGHLTGAVGGVTVTGKIFIGGVEVHDFQGTGSADLDVITQCISC